MSRARPPRRHYVYQVLAGLVLACVCANTVIFVIYDNPSDRRIGLVFYAILGASFTWLVSMAWRTRHPVRTGDVVLCPKCGYDLRGRREANCPECGAEFTLEERVG